MFFFKATRRVFRGQVSLTPCLAATACLCASGAALGCRQRSQRSWSSRGRWVGRGAEGRPQALVSSPVLSCHVTPGSWDLSSGRADLLGECGSQGIHFRQVTLRRTPGFSHCSLQGAWLPCSPTNRFSVCHSVSHMLLYNVILGALYGTWTDFHLIDEETKA